MRTRNSWSGILLLSSAALVAACGSDPASPGGMGGAAGTLGSGGSGAAAGMASSGGSAGAGGAPMADCDHIDFASYAKAPPVSFRSDVMPIFGFQCTLSSCHRPADHKAGLVLGYRCAPDMSAKFGCRFPTAPTYIEGSTSIDATKEQPLDEATVAMVRMSLLSPAETVNGKTVARVAPMHPEASFILQKVAGTQNKQGYTCTNQDPRYSQDPCGILMPLGGEPMCQGSYRPRFDALAAWIAQGAPDN